MPRQGEFTDATTSASVIRDEAHAWPMRHRTQHPTGFFQANEKKPQLRESFRNRHSKASSKNLQSL
jgi:hypothetical protein